MITPHEDVACGRYEPAEFAADLHQVQRGEGSDEYRDPREFYRRTFLTAGLSHLLTNALMRLSGEGGAPVVELQTNFGGGKTHSILALYHLFSGESASDLTSIEELLSNAGLEQPRDARRAVRGAGRLRSLPRPDRDPSRRHRGQDHVGGDGLAARRGRRLRHRCPGRPERDQPRLPAQTLSCYCR